jgi:hypothetical protein
MRNKEADILEAFVAHLAGNGNPGLRVDRYPDREPATAPTEAIDAIAGPFAIEHTTIHALDEKPMRDDWFCQAGASLEDELRGAIPFQLRIQFSYLSVETGQKWPKVKESLKSWILNEASHLPDGFHTIRPAGVPFDIEVEKRMDEGPGVLFYRKVSAANDTLVSSIATRIPGKAGKLAAYQSRGLTTILLLESDDIAMMNHVKAAEALELNFADGLPAGVDIVWYADTTLSRDNARFFNLTELIAKYPRKE